VTSSKSTVKTVETLPTILPQEDNTAAEGVKTTKKFMEKTVDKTPADMMTIEKGADPMKPNDEAVDETTQIGTDMQKNIADEAANKGSDPLKQMNADEKMVDYRVLGNNVQGRIPAPAGFDQSGDNSEYCTVNFYSKKNLASSETLYFGEGEVSRPYLKKYDKKIDRIDYDCTSRCEIILYAGQRLSYHNIGFYTSEESSTIYLNEYMSYDQINDEWDQWDRTASSYYILCPDF